MATPTPSKPPLPRAPAATSALSPAKTPSGATPDASNGTGEPKQKPKSGAGAPTPTAIPPFSCRKCQASLEVDSSFVELKEKEASFLEGAGLGLGADENFLIDLSTKARAQVEAQAQSEGGVVEGSATAIALCLAADEKLDIEYPLCEECAGVVIDELRSKLDLAERELETYEDHLEELTATAVTVVPQEEFDAEMKQSMEEERRLVDELARIEQSRVALMRDIEVLGMENKELDEIESKYWQDFNDYQALLSDCEEQRDAICTHIDRLNLQLDKLKRTNVFNDAFHIWHDGHFGTICNLRLGRLPSVRVPFDEINAAWGQAVLLLYSLARKCQFTFSTYRLIPMGSFSKMARISDDSNTYELYTNGPVLGFWSRRYDQAMTWFLHCVQEFGEWMARQDPGFKLPYWIKDDTVNGMSIQKSSKEEEWTKALKYMLTNLKWMLAWVARKDGAASKAEREKRRQAADGFM